MGYNLDDKEFDAKEGAIIFNNGQAGIVENVTMTVKRKTPEDKEKAPDYKLTFTDEKGGTSEMSFWYVKEATEHKSIDEQIAAQGKVLKHVLNTIYGEETRPKVGGETPQQFLDSGMKAIRDGLMTRISFRVFANFGVAPSATRKGKVSKYIGIRTWVPFMESMAVDLAETRLKQSDFDAMTKVEETVLGMPQGGSVTNDGDDW